MKLQKLSDIKIHRKKIHYEFKEVDFLTSTVKSYNLIVVFHGGRGKAKLPIFRGFDWYIKKSNILSFSDLLYKKYNSLDIGWYLDTKKYKQTDTIYEIIKYMEELTSSKRIIFVS